MRKADAALYAAKRRGRGRCEAFGDHINAHSLLRLELESDLRLAVEREELVLHYQPIISLTTGEVKGLEALVRWNHPTRGIISPLDFIPVAEETGLILSIGRWIFHEACRQMQQWRKLYPTASDMYVSVNLSARQFQQPSLLGNVSRSLAEFDLPPSCVTLEITETVVMEETEFTLTTLAALKATGLRLAIDDFGTGYSSLSYLRRFPVDYLKIDRTFIDGLGRGSEDGLIVSSTIGLAHSLGLQVIAEGAETAEQVRLLCQLSCDNVQGYYFSQPLPAAEIELMLASAKAYPLPAGLAEPIGQTEQRKVEGAVCLEPDTQSRRVLTANVGAA
jgi:EAL domain-containing protein (putative c-di-GMP-specific phosphodiesterase class I)